MLQNEYTTKQQRIKKIEKHSVETNVNYFLIISHSLIIRIFHQLTSFPCNNQCLHKVIAWLQICNET